MLMRRVFSVLVSTLLANTSCSRSNNLLLGRIETKVGSRNVVVTDCYRTKAPQPTWSGNRYAYEPCRDARIVIDGDQLSVNGTNYGRLDPEDSVLVDHGTVSIQRNRLANVH
jgi:hypothetical protein